jgi:OmpA-OmpF porin, OOP family
VKEQPADKGKSGTVNRPSGQQQGAQPAPAGGNVMIENAEVVYSKYDFIPGDKVIFFDDFSDTDVGEFPRKWTLNGPKGGNNNAVEVVEYQGKRFLRNNPAAKGKNQSESTQYLRLNVKGDLPERFTVEFDAVFANAIPGGYPNQYFLLLMNSRDGWLGNSPHTLGVTHLSGDVNASKNTRTNVGLVDGRVHHVAVSVNGTFLKAYIDNIRVINDPDGVKRPITLVGMSIHSGGNLPSDKVMFTNFRLAEGGKSILSALSTDGRIVTHGILFDTGSDVIKPESLPTLKAILAVLNDNPGVNFTIEGHTDNQGNRAINQPLSEKRAAAVRAWLVNKGVPAARLRAVGFGDSRPIDSNATPEGQANNRRVEFVKF